MEHTRENTLVLFDVDGTLTPARLKIEPDMVEVIAELRKKVTVGLVGGSDLSKQKEQMGPKVLDMFDYVFVENGLEAFHDGELIHRQDIKKYLGEENLKQFINFCLHYIADLDIPVKRGTFIEFRNGMLNVSPIGRNCNQEERIAFNEYDNEHHIRRDMVSAIYKKFPDLGIQCTIGGQISFDVFPIGWDKTYCLRHVKDCGFKEIHFFGDKTFEGGNDFEIYTHDETIGHSVKSPKDTIEIVRSLFL
eukprot:TRINITY_DN726_c0_g1_i1.p1 TRINITY_DN726_c0_g1~~TRINITY_DN726_c0_g1_i1.p1  ORF type:complete len:291 (+),score=77.79 TRINITY_DN726_c0_g1_i1:131-874(+)